MTTARAELEARLRANPHDADTHAVYADALMTEGEPRGEQIAIELAQPERRPLLVRWLASHLALKPGGDHVFVTDASWLSFLASPIGEFCRGVSATARMEEARKLADATAAKRRPFLTRFKMYAGYDGPLVLDARHVAATPNLVELDLDGDFDLRAVRHPAVKKLRRESWSQNGLRSWTWPVDLPACEELVVEWKPWSPSVAPGRVTFDGLPALRALDASACEPMRIAGQGPAVRSPGENTDVFRWLAGLPLLPGLRALRVPSVRTAGDARRLRDIIARAPAATIEVARMYTRCSAGVELASERVRFAPPWPWPPDDQSHKPWQYRLSGPRGIALDLSSGGMCDGLERTFDRRDERYRDDWRQIWRALDDSAIRPQRLAWGVVVRAFDGFPVEDVGSATSLRNDILKLRDRIGAGELVELTPKP